MLQAKVIKHALQFAFPAKTSRGTLSEKPTWYVKVFDAHNPEKYGLGECSPIWGLSPEDENTYDDLVNASAASIRNYEQLFNSNLRNAPSVFFGFETALIDLFKGGNKLLFESDFTNGKSGIPINGLIWMNTIDEMYKQAKEKAAAGFSCIKLKIGGLNTDDEISLLKTLRAELGEKVILRVDANGAFDFSTALQVLLQLKEINIHSIEQPIQPGQYDQMRQLCKKNIVPVALDEELIGHCDVVAKEKLIADLKPHYIILKPSLHGGFKGSREWINAAQKNNAGWWMTSALESNVGLNAIAQYTAQSGNTLHHGLGTGKIYMNNIASPLNIQGEKLHYNPAGTWQPV